MPVATTYTWTCPRCGTPHVSATPTVPDRCSNCGQPSGSADPSLEREEPGLPEDAPLDVVPEPTPDPSRPMERGQTFSTGPLQIDEGWLAYILRAIDRASGHEENGVQQYTGLSGGTYHGLARDIAKMYAGPRPVLLCGCKAGLHDDSIEGMASAHPERLR